MLPRQKGTWMLAANMATLETQVLVTDTLYIRRPVWYPELGDYNE